MNALAHHNSHEDDTIIVDRYNQRIKVYDANPEAISRSILQPLLTETSPEIGKVIAYTRATHRTAWQCLGFCFEGTIRGYFQDDADAQLWSYSVDPARANSEAAEHNATVLKTATAKVATTPVVPQGLTLQLGRPDDAARIANFLQEHFSDYPSSLSPQTIRDNIANQANHYRMFLNEQETIVSLASAEIDHQRNNAELTDCATHPDFRGQGLIAYILYVLEQDVQKEYGITQVYTLARAGEFGMNCAFAKLGYDYTGTLIKNCRMPTGWESMNIWSKILA